MTLMAAILALGTATAQAQPAPSRPQVVVQGPVGARLDEYMSRLEALGFSGGLTVVKGGETVLLKGYGQADRGALDAASVDSGTHRSAQLRPASDYHRRGIVRHRVHRVLTDRVLYMMRQ